jgi:osmotically-inducible protein OsmY
MNKFIQKTDAQIQRDVLDELKWDTRVRETDIGVEVHQGIVKLTGAVGSWTERLAAQEAAHRVGSVMDVANDVEVKLPNVWVRTDTDIAKAVRSALESDLLVPDQKIRSTVTEGTVTLEGTVEYWTQYDDASRAVRNLYGVKRVNNQLAVVAPIPGVSASTVQSVIESALERHVAHVAKRVSVNVNNGNVTLSGDVPSWSERRAIEGAVRGTPGVNVVQNQLRIGV